MNSADLKNRTKQFALSVVRLYCGLPKTTEAQVLGRQALRSGTSVGAQYREATSFFEGFQWLQFASRS
jgi:four helix bundle protein